jgi:amino acid adenylation domain-containing protein
LGELAVMHANSPATTNPFADETAEYVVLRNDEGQHSVWPGAIDPPAGWTFTGVQGLRGVCLDWIDAHWTDMRPRSLACGDAVAEGGACLHELFAYQVLRTPHAVALRHGDRSVTFLELEADANQLARHLMSLGVRPETLTALPLDRSIDAVVAMLAVLKAGGGYIVLDPSYPERRLHEITDYTRPVAAVTAERWRDRLESSSSPIVVVDRDAGRIANQPSTAPLGGAVPDNIAYVGYTSGSTGSPKAVISTHRGMTNGLNDVPFHRDDPRTVCALSAPLAFGFSVAQLFLPLLCGIPVVLIPESDAKDVVRIAEAIDAGHVTSMAFVTPFMREILRAGPRVTSRLQRLRTVTVGGSPVTPDLVAAFREALPAATLLLGYAASEAGGAIMTSVGPAVPEGPVTLGTPFPYTRVALLDASLRSVLPGEPGEIYVGAPHLSRGYLRQPGLTAERFIADPTGDVPGARLYRTGDFGRVLANGEVEYLGRVDDQVKIRGYRVALWEVEAVLQDHGQVRDAAVWARHVGDHLQLAAAIVPRISNPPVRDLRAHVRARLPEYMMPSAFVFLEALPMTSTGKVDRLALAQLQIPASSSDPFVAPRTDVERRVAEIWSQALGVDRVGMTDTFLDLGGDSLSAVQVIVGLQEAFGVQVPLEALFEPSTVAAFVHVHLHRAEGVSAV